MTKRTEAILENNLRLSSMKATEKFARLRLIRTENVGSITFRKLLERFGTAENALEALPSLSKHGGRSVALKAFPKDHAEKEIEHLTKYGARWIAEGEDDYPPLLAQLEDAPPILTVLGDVRLLSRKALSIVGARNASLTGKKIAADYAAKAGGAGYAVVSGLARGIDTAAHTAALPSGTIAVIAGGIDNIYPPENEKLYRDIAARGAIVAESPFGTEPLARHFPKRNRIVSGLSLGVVVVEAAAKSGSLITARLALEQNREVFAVPGSPLDPRAEGTNSLLRDGAHMAASSDDILRVLNSLRLHPLRDAAGDDWQPAPVVAPMPAPKLYDAILENLSHAPIHVDELVRATQASVPDVLATILCLELAGRALRHAGNRVSLA